MGAKKIWKHDGLTERSEQIVAFEKNSCFEISFELSCAPYRVGARA